MKFIYLLSACALSLSMGSCNQDKAPATETKTEIIKVEAPAPEKKIIVEEKKPNTIVISPEGTSVKTKKIDVEIK